ncbi:MAG: type I toxin-antitoxin system SymE family toxin [Lachnospiraceae bacterium]|nr:type I toxin-antitoxin system SymE family toxin [Lachnospiraceae bacterium]
MKENRTLTVYYGNGGYNRPSVPVIHMQGKWLEALDFDIGEQINVECQEGRLIITKANEVVVD